MLKSSPLSKFSLVGPVLYDKIETRTSSVKLFRFWGPLSAGGPLALLNLLILFAGIIYNKIKDNL